MGWRDYSTGTKCKVGVPIEYVQQPLILLIFYQYMANLRQVKNVHDLFHLLVFSYALWVLVYMVKGQIGLSYLLDKSIFKGEVVVHHHRTIRKFNRVRYSMGSFQ